jgi:hypothetical protein
MADAKIGQLKLEFTTEYYLRETAPTISIDVLPSILLNFHNIHSVL